ncbi:MAG: P27 family phage terminase small subunit [Xanthobacteraceae bacterium]
MAGRPKKPTEIKELSGTLRKHRTNPDEPTGTRGWPPLPSFLSERAAEIFAETCRAMESMGTLAVEWGDVIGAYAASQEEVEVYTAIIAEEGQTYTTTTQMGDTMHRARPEVAMRSDAMRRAQQFRSELGLGPASKSKVSAGKKHEANPYEEIDN